MPRFSTVVVCTSPRRPVLIPTNTFGGVERLLKDDFARVPFLSSSPPAPSALRAFETSFPPPPPSPPARARLYLNSLQYPVALVAKLIKSRIGIREEARVR